MRIDLERASQTPSLGFIAFRPVADSFPFGFAQGFGSPAALRSA
jgi:hypothetical protein